MADHPREFTRTLLPARSLTVRVKIIRGLLPFESKLLPAVLLFLRISFPQITVTLGVVLSHLPVGKKIPRFCPA